MNLPLNSDVMFNIRKTLRPIWNIFALLGIAATFVSIYTWYEFNDLSLYGDEKEEFRLTSPNSVYDAVVTIMEAGGFGSSQVQLYIVPAKTEFSENIKFFKHPAFRSHAIRTNEILWKDDATLILIRGSKDQIYEFSPTIYDKRDIDNTELSNEEWRYVSLIIKTKGY